MSKKTNEESSWINYPKLKDFIEESKKKFGKKYRSVSFQSAWKCTICSCTQYEGEDAPSSLCKNCGHERHRHELRT